MAQYIDKASVVVEIERLIEKAKAERVLYAKTILAAMNYLLIEKYNKLLSFLDSLEVKEVDFEAFGVLAKHLIACDAHGITPKYSDRELDFLEGLANEAQKGK